MRRRGMTVLVGAVVVALLAVGVMATPVPYVVLDPGPTVDTLGQHDGEQVIDIVGTDVSESEGQLRLTTVGVDQDISLLAAVGSWFSRDEAVVPREMIYPPGQTREQVEQRNQEQFTRSQSAAEVAALRQLGYPGQVVVMEVVAGSPAEGALAEGDIVVSVNGTEVTSAADLQQLVSEQPVGTSLTVDYLRDGTAGTVEVISAADGDEQQSPRVGVVVTQELDVPFELTIDLGGIGGPSAGLMFALGIINKLEPEDLTGGRIIAGTGSIDENGNVGGIGGVPQKLVAAHEVGADVFLVPAGNCQEAVRNAQPGLTMISVETLTGALEDLAAVREGQQPTTC